MFLLNIVQPFAFSQEVGEKGISLHKVVEINELPVLEVQSVSEQVLLVRVVDEGHSRRGFQLAFEHSNVVPRVVAAKPRSGRANSFQRTQVTFDLQNDTEHHSELVFGHLLSLLLEHFLGFFNVDVVLNWVRSLNLRCQTGESLY